MDNDKYILVRVFCEQSHIDDDFVRNLHNYGLVELEEREDEQFLQEDDISEIERLFRIHRDLGVNYEGLDVIREMMERMKELEQEMRYLRKRLRIYE